jgi:hypothetical protein
VVAKGRRRRITAGPRGVRYLAVHRRRDGLGITPMRSPSDALPTRDPADRVHSGR